jgi:hypothetical protein
MSDISTFQAWNQAWLLYNLYGTVTNLFRTLPLVRMPKLSMLIATPREAVSTSRHIAGLIRRIELNFFGYAESLVGTADDLLDWVLFHQCNLLG